MMNNNELIISHRFFPINIYFRFKPFSTWELFPTAAWLTLKEMETGNTW